MRTSSSVDEQVVDCWNMSSLQWPPREGSSKMLWYPLYCAEFPPPERPIRGLLPNADRPINRLLPNVNILPKKKSNILPDYRRACSRRALCPISTNAKVGGRSPPSPLIGRDRPRAGDRPTAGGGRAYTRSGDQSRAGTKKEPEEKKRHLEGEANVIGQVGH
eukprot:9400690-Pyramimonas_sp.AAC.1